MNELFNRVENDFLIFVENFAELSGADLSGKILCIIKTDFSDIEAIHKFCEEHAGLEVWLAAENLSKDNMRCAKSCGIKHVVSYPVDTKLIQEFFKERNKLEKPYEHCCDCFLKGLNVMIVDDNQMNIDLLIETLGPLGLKLHTFLKPKEASHNVSIEKYDLFLLDIMMPEMTGFELAKIIKNTQLNADTPIMFISALSDPENKIHSFNLGSCAYIEKPFNINVVRSQVYNVLKTKKLQDALMDTKETFLATVTHDLKTPVNAEIRALELLLNNQNSNFTSFENEIITDLLEAAKYMKSLVDNVLQKYKCDSGKITLDKQTASLEELTLECIEEIKYLLNEKHLEINVNSSVKDVRIAFDIIEIKRVIHNLITNAINYAKNDTKIQINLFQTENELGFSVTDHGVGINLDDKNKIFEKYESFAHEKKHLGTGLGLYISKKIVEAHGGTICAESEPEKYTTITFTLPKNI